MANRDFKVMVWKVGGPTISLRISAVDAVAAQRAAEEGGWTVQGVEDAGPPGPEPDATLNSLRDEIRGLKDRLEAVESSPAIARLGWSVFCTVIGALAVWTVLCLVLGAMSRR